MFHSLWNTQSYLAAWASYFFSSSAKGGTGACSLARNLRREKRKEIIELLQEWIKYTKQKSSLPPTRLRHLGKLNKLIYRTSTAWNFYLWLMHYMMSDDTLNLHILLMSPSALWPTSSNSRHDCVKRIWTHKLVPVAIAYWCIWRTAASSRHWIFRKQVMRFLIASSSCPLRASNSSLVIPS